MTIKLPKRGYWKQDNLGDRYGDIQSSFNLDLSNEQGKIKVSPRLLVNTETADEANLDVAPFAIIYNSIESEWHVGAGADMFVGGNLPNEAFAEDTATDSPSFETTGRPDLAYFNGLTYGMSAELYRLDAGGADWDVITSLTGSTNGAPLIPFGATGRLYYRISKDQMGSINTAETPVAPTNQYAIDLNDDTHQISCGRASSEYIYLGTIADNTTARARVHAWNGSSTSVSATYEIDAQGVLAMCVQDNVPIILDSNGVLRRLNGGAFVEIARLPLKEFKPVRSLISGNHTQYLCHYNGMVADKSRILMNINSTYADGTTDENVPSGLWEYNEINGLFHRGSFGTTKSGGTITDYGGAKVSAIGALAMAKVNDSSTNGSILAGATIYTTATATKVGIFYDDSNDTLQKAGILVTAKLFSDNITDSWHYIYPRFRQFLNSTDKMVVKARTTEDVATEATITYTSTTTFTVPTASFSTAPAVGDEVEIIQGVGAGRTAHITTVTTSAPNYVITVDETITGATTQTAKARFQTWKKLGSFSKQDVSFEKFICDQTVLGASPWIQFKIWFLWTGDNEMYDAIVSSSVSQKIE